MGERSGAPRASALHQSSFRNLRLRFNYHSQMSQLTVTHPTHWGEGDHLRARPMAVRPVPEEGALYFLTDADAPKL